MIAVGLVRAYLARGSYHGLYYSIEKPLKFFQTGALLEVSLEGCCFTGGSALLRPSYPGGEVTVLPMRGQINHIFKRVLTDLRKYNHLIELYWGLPVH